jgi:hypothetical protein
MAGNLSLVGYTVGITVGSSVGTSVGITVSITVGVEVGTQDGVTDGWELGSLVGYTVTKLEEVSYLIYLFDYYNKCYSMRLSTYI